MPDVTAIKSERDYRAALEEIRGLIRTDPDPDSPVGNRLDVLSTLVEAYEAKAFPLEFADAVDAIEFRMEQQNLSPRDLVPFLGSRSRVSEVLARKRPLTLPMVRALHDGLRIPAKLLLRQPALSTTVEDDLSWGNFPVREMIGRGWIRNVRDLRSFFSATSAFANLPVLCRQCHIRSARPMDPYALTAWTARILIRAQQLKSGRFRRGSVTQEFMTEVARFSSREKGPAEVCEFLRHHGIPTIIEPHLKHTYLDGAAVLFLGHAPVIGITVRHDRLDNFWFTLMHELAHVSLHYESEETEFIDDLDVRPHDDPKEEQADHVAGEALIPSSVWRKSPASRLRSVDAALHLARQLQIHPAIVAGRIRHSFKSFRVLNQLIGHREVRRCFPSIEWERND
jgi:HTH-type transcriptional regulator / antitoxin HigA